MLIFIGIKRINWRSAIFHCFRTKLIWGLKSLFQPRHFKAIRRIKSHEQYVKLNGFITTGINIEKLSNSGKNDDEYYQIWVSKPGTQEIRVIQATVNKATNELVEFRIGNVEF